jgi:hypothetical protein
MCSYFIQMYRNTSKKKLQKTLGPRADNKYIYIIIKGKHLLFRSHPKVLRQLQALMVALLDPPPPLSSGLLVLGQGPRVTGKGDGATAGQFPAHMLWRGFPTAMIHPNMTEPFSHLDGPPFSSKGTPLQAHQSRSAVILGGNGGGGGMTHERGGIELGGGGGGGGWGTIVAS